MTRYKDLNTENIFLKKQVERLQKELEFYKKKHYTTSNIGRFKVIHYGDGRHTVSTVVHSKDFIAHNKLEYDYVLNAAIYQVSERYKKDALDLIFMNGVYLPYGNLKFYSDSNVPLDSVIINPKLKHALKNTIINGGGSLNYAEHILRGIIEDAEYI
ncbi:MAG: hypothetical protein PHH48_06530 [Eubacteriales bacterium]|nr:hypothetical protein [Eubacteriales bacterium]